MLDPSIITNGAINAQTQQANNMNMLGDLGGAFGKLLLARQINDMNQMATPEEEKAFAQKHKLFAPQLMQQYNDNRASEAKALKDGLKFDADLNKTYADTAQTYALGRKNDADAGKSTAEGEKVGVESKGLRIDQNNKLDTMVWGEVLYGGKNAGIAQLEIQKSSGLIDEATYNQKLGLINNLPTDPAQAQKYAFAMYKGIQDPKYNLTTGDQQLQSETSANNNIRDNTTSANNNIRTTQASMYSSDNSLKGTMYSSDNSLKGSMYTADQATYRTEKEIAAEKAKGKQQLINGLVYTVYPDGTADAFIDHRTGQQATSLGATGSASNKAMTESQAKDNLFVGRMSQSNQIINNLESQGVGATVASRIPFVGDSYSQSMPSILGGANQQQLQYAQAQRDFINAVLRKESGAVIGKDEFENAKKQYFPQIGDGPEVIKQKAQNRQTAIELINSGLPGAYQQNLAPPASIAAPKTPSGKARPPLGEILGGM